MRNSIFSVFIVLLSFLLFSCNADMLTSNDSNQNDQPTQFAKKPAANTTVTIVVNFTPTPPTVWNGTAEFEDGAVYALTFISYVPPRDYSNASPFLEDFIIYKPGTDWTLMENVIMKGTHKGVSVFGQDPLDPAKFLANGKITEAYGEYSDWLGRSAHTRGTFTWIAPGFPDEAIATIRIN